jgi:hypothetical protein
MKKLKVFNNFYEDIDVNVNGFTFSGERKMKNLTILAAAGIMALALTACSSANKDAKVSDEVIDAGMHSNDPIKVKGSDVIDAGVYHENETNMDVASHGGQNGAVIPTEHFYTVDREKHVTAGKMLYVLTDDSPAHCIKARYVQVEGRKKLVVYSKSTVPSNFCIYQKSFSSDAEGFSIFVNKGGVCKPSFTHIAVDDQKRKLASVEPVNNTVSMAYCTEGTVSYGEELAHH